MYNDNNLNNLEKLRKLFKAREISAAIVFASAHFNEETSDIILSLMGVKKIFDHSCSVIYDDVYKKLLDCSIELREEIFTKAFSHRGFYKTHPMVASEILQELDLVYISIKETEINSNSTNMTNILDCKYERNAAVKSTIPLNELVVCALNLNDSIPTSVSYAFGKALTK